MFEVCKRWPVTRRIFLSSQNQKLWGVKGSTFLGQDLASIKALCSALVRPEHFLCTSLLQRKHTSGLAKTRSWTEHTEHFCTGPPIRSVEGESRTPGFDPALLPTTKDTLICGDLNCHSTMLDGNQPPDQMGERLVEWLLDSGMGCLLYTSPSPRD